MVWWYRWRNSTYHTGCFALQVSYPIGCGSNFLGVMVVGASIWPHLAPRFKKRGAVPPFPYITPWYPIKHKNNFYFKFLIKHIRRGLGETLASIISHDSEGSGTGGIQLYTGDFCFKTRQPLLPQIHRNVPESLQANARIVQRNITPPLTLTLFKIHQSLIILIFHVI
jgi:hypothetical protein